MKLSSRNCLAITRKDILLEWNYTRNTIDPINVTVGSNQKVWWICKNNHEWMATIANRCGRNSKCPYCLHKLASQETCMAFTNPELIKEWHPEKNGILTPFNLLPSAQRKVWWKCKNNHEWKETPAHRTRGGNCPYCLGRRVCKDNSFGQNSIELLKEWNFSKNKNINPNEVTTHSNKKVWWKCSLCNFEWIASIKNRDRYTGCPACSKITLSDGEQCDSLVEALFYLKYKEQGIPFIHSGKYGGGLGKSRYDFFFPDQNKYVEITSYSGKSRKNIDLDFYYKRIQTKRQYVVEILKASFEFIQHLPTWKEYRFVRSNIKKVNV